MLNIDVLKEQLLQYIKPRRTHEIFNKNFVKPSEIKSICYNLQCV